MRVSGVLARGGDPVSHALRALDLKRTYSSHTSRLVHGVINKRRKFPAHFQLMIKAVVARCDFGKYIRVCAYKYLYRWINFDFISMSFRREL